MGIWTAGVKRDVQTVAQFHLWTRQKLSVISGLCVDATPSTSGFEALDPDFQQKLVKLYKMYKLYTFFGKISNLPKLFRATKK